MASSKAFGVAARLIAGFGFLLILMIGLTFYSTGQVAEINRNLGLVNDINSVKQRFAINYRGSRSRQGNRHSRRDARDLS